MVVPRIRQAGRLKPQMRGRELRVGQAGMPSLIKRAMELANRFSIYKRGEPLVSRHASSNAARGLASRLKRFQTQRLPRAPHIRCPQTTFRHLSHPNFSVFHPFFKVFKKFFTQPPRHCPPCAESPRRTLAQPKNRGISRQNAPFLPRRSLKIARKTPLQSPKKPAPHAPPHKKVE